MIRYQAVKVVPKTRCVTLYDFLAHYFFAMALEVVRLSRIFVRERESGERYSKQLFSTHTVIVIIVSLVVRTSALKAECYICVAKNRCFKSPKYKVTHFF